MARLTNLLIPTKLWQHLTQIVQPSVQCARIGSLQSQPSIFEGFRVVNSKTVRRKRYKKVLELLIRNNKVKVQVSKFTQNALGCFAKYAARTASLSFSGT